MQKTVASISCMLAMFMVGTCAMGQTSVHNLTVKKDTLVNDKPEEVVVTATRTERRLSNIAVPFTMITQQQIQAAGVVRMQELLQEQTGLFITSGSGTAGMGGGVFGNGVQIQGMSPDYTLILINGEPVIGRQGGTLNLSRFTVANIKKVEVVKGPSSSLYGSEAMGGVINIITEQPQQNKLGASLRMGSYGIVDACANGSFIGKKSSTHVALNSYRFGGSDYNNNLVGYTQDPFTNNTAQVQYNQLLGTKTKLLVFARYSYEQTKNLFDANVNTTAPQKLIDGRIRINDVNINPTIQHRFSNKVTTSLRLYGTMYESIQQLNEENTSISYYYDYFKQQFFRIENQTNITLPANNTLSVGGGFVREILNTNRYEGERTNNIAYGFVQNEWQPTAQWNIIGGLRYDANEDYASRLSPKLAVRYSPNNRLKFTASYGAGFRAPDYRQLYLSLVNPAAGGYAIYGSNEISTAKLQALQQQGFISTILPRASDLKELKPETSNGFNIGAQYKWDASTTIDVNLFNNDISNQIIFDIIALRGNGQQVYSYFNVKRSFTRGGEVNIQHQINSSFTITAGYQLLFTGDKDVVAAIANGKMFGRSEANNEVYALQRSDYYGLPNRSKHMLNVKLFYRHQPSGWSASVRGIYRSRWGTNDVDGNGIINRTDETANGFLQLNANVSKDFNTHWRVMLGAENLLNYRDAVNIPNVLGINGYISIHYQFQKRK